MPLRSLIDFKFPPAEKTVPAPVKMTQLKSASSCVSPELQQSRDSLGEFLSHCAYLRDSS